MSIDTVESWSAPWHRLQKTLANASGGSAPIHPLAVRKRGAVPTRPVASNWLVKAQRLTIPVALEPR
jgi:hypothetical protein